MSNTDGYLQAIQGLPVGSSARQGMVRENRFYHADLQFTLAFPQGWQIVNQPDKILAIAPRKEHYLEIRTQSPPADLTNPRDFALRGLANKRLARTETLEINGLKAWTGVVRGDPSPFGQATNVRYVVIYYANLMWVFKGASRSGMEAPSGDPFFVSTANTFRRMRGNEFALAEPYRLRVVQAKDGTTMETLAAESSIQKYPLQQLRLINKLYPDGEPQPGDYVKTVQ
jgi:predicted Zn-dependent protease